MDSSRLFFSNVNELILFEIQGIKRIVEILTVLILIE